MPTYRYEGNFRNGEPVSGTIKASNEDEARDLLNKERIRPEILQDKRSAAVYLRSRVPLKYVSAFTRQFSSMISSAIPLVQSLDSIAEQTEHKTLRNAVRRISADVQSGISLAEAISGHPGIFNRLYCAMVRAGEAAGILSGVLLRLAEYQEKAVAVRRRVASAFAYPALIAVVAAGAVVALLTFVVPTFASMLSDLGAQPPISTRIVIGISSIVSAWIVPATLVCIFGASTILYLYQKNDAVRLSIDAMQLNLPLFGGLIKKSAVSRFARTFGALLNGGVPIAEALEITSDTAGNRVLEKGFQKAVEAIRSGRPLAAPLKETKVFPPMVVQMIDVGEQSGNLPEMLGKISEYYDTEVDSAITTLTSLLEPVLIVAMGIIIAGVLISMYLPMFEMVNAIG